MSWDGWFCHIFSPDFDETGLLDVPASKGAVAEIDAEITALAPVLHTRSRANGATVISSEEIGESRTLSVEGGKFEDSFAADYAVHLYKITP